MEECCVVCAEPLEWIGYGVCGHRDVCSTCIARLRFVLNNKSCCICKQECNSVLMTKALGDFTKVVKDFESLHDHGDLWYESNIHAYFDDEEHFEMVKAMCRLSCQICEEVEAAESGKDFVKKGYVFRSLDLLRRHLLIGHKVQMCSLCLEGRKIFICEQKLYSRVQMDRHLAKGDSEVDGVGEERGGFSGHPMCDFCRSRFYSDNELYQHMSVDHYICHICQRLHPGHYDYFHKYDDLEIHFRHEHALCEHPDCLAKKFVVFISDAELKRHNASMHGGNMSRSQRNAALQIPVSFQYRWPIQGRVSSRNGVNYSNGQLSVGAQGSIVSNTVELAVGGSLTFCNGTSSHNTKINVAESSARGDESSSRSEPSCGGTGLPCLEESAFPPLPGSKHARRKSKQQTRGSTVSMTAVLGVRDGGRWPSTSSGQSQVHGRTEGDASRSNVSNVAMPNRWSQAPARKTISEEVVPVIHSASALYGRNLTHIGGERVNARLPVAESSSMGETHNVVVPHLTDAVRIANKALIECIRSKLGNDEKLFAAFKDLSAQFKRGKIDASVYYKHIISLGLWELVPELARLCPDPEKQRDLLEAYEKGQKDKQSSALKEDSPSMERSAITQSSARRAKDAVKEDACEQTSIQSAICATIALRLTDRGGTNGENDDVEVLSKDRYCDLKGKHRAESSSCRSWFSVGSSLVNGAHNPQAKVLVKGTGTVDLPALICESIPSGVDKCWSCNVCTLENSELDSHCAACETSRSDAASSAATVQAQGHGKRKKKTSKFERARLDDGSLVLSLESRWSDPAMSNPAPSAQRSSGRGAWKNGGGQRLVALAQREDAIESAWKM